MRCSYCGKRIEKDEEYIDLGAQGCIHFDCMNAYKDAISEIAELSDLSLDEDLEERDDD